MSLKSTEVENCSRIIKAILISPFRTSSCCQTRFPTLIRPMLCLWGLISKMKFILQNCIAPSSSRCTVWLCRRRLITFVDTSYAARDGSDGSMSIHLLSCIGMILGVSTGSLFCGLAFAFDLAAITFTLVWRICSSCGSGRIFVLIWTESIKYLTVP